MKEFLQKKIFGAIPLWFFIGLLVATLIAMYTGAMSSGIVGALCVMMVLGHCLGYIGDHIPIWKDWLGGGALFTTIVAMLMASAHLIPEEVGENLSNFQSTVGWLDLYIIMLITGSLLAINRKILIRSFLGYIPCILAGVLGSFLFACAVGKLVGFNVVEAILNYALPIMGGGVGAGAVPLSNIYEQVTGKSGNEWFTAAYAVLMVANMIAVACSALLNKLGDVFPKWNGHGKLMTGQNNMADDGEERAPATAADYAAGIILALVCYAFADWYASKVSLINHSGIGITIHKYFFCIIFIAILNALGIVPASIRAGALGIQKFFIKYMSFPLLFMIGANSSLDSFISVLNLKSVLMMAAVIIGACCGVWLIAPLFKFNRIEAMITAALCMANSGGGGDIQCLGAAKRMELMAYAQISSRIGGSIILAIGSVLFSILL